MAGSDNQVTNRSERPADTVVDSTKPSHETVRSGEEVVTAGQIEPYPDPTGDPIADDDGERDPKPGETPAG